LSITERKRTKVCEKVSLCFFVSGLVTLTVYTIMITLAQ
jgi:hypothetical protein